MELTHQMFKENNMRMYSELVQTMMSLQDKITEIKLQQKLNDIEEQAKLDLGVQQAQRGIEDTVTAISKEPD